MFNYKRIIAVILSALMCFSLVSCSNQEIEKVENEVEARPQNSIVFFETDNDADSALISANGVNIMIDTGEKKDRKLILKKLEEMGVNKLDYLIFSHFDKDHIGGALKLLEEIEVGLVLHPNYVKDSEEAEKLFALIREKGIEEQAISLKDSIEVKGVKLSFIPAEKETYFEKESNNSSLIVKAEIDGIKALFMGDCQDERVEELLDSDNDFSADILKLMYHGREIENEKELVDRINPKYTVVTAKDSKKTHKNIDSLNLENVFFNQNGTIVFEIENSNINVKQ